MSASLALALALRAGLTAILILFGAVGWAQQVPASFQNGQRYSGYLELGGPTGIGSVNVERRLWSTAKYEVKARAGFFLLPNGSLTRVKNSYFLPLGFHWLKGRIHQLEIGTGTMLTVNNNSFLEGKGASADPEVYGQGFLGYRWQQVEGGWFLRAGYVPLYHPDMEAPSAESLGAITGSWMHWASVGIGMNF